MRLGPFIARQDGDYYNCEFNYSPEMIAYLKSSIPRRHRWWDPRNRCWTIQSAYLSTVLDHAEYMGFTTRVEHESDYADPDNDRDYEDDEPLPRNTSGDATTDFAHLLSYDALHAAYKKMSLEVHPDRPGGGNPDAMKRLNGIWDQIKKRFGK
jgi:hypothetical protein